MGTSPPPPSGGDEHDPPFFPTGFAEGGYFDEPLWAITSEYDHPELVIDEGDPMNNGITTEPTMLPLRGPGAVIPLDDMPPEIAPFEDYQTAAGFNDEPFMPAPQPRGFLDHLGMAAATAQFPQPKGFGEGLLGGALRGFGQARMSPIMQEQERRKYAAEQNRKNAEATAKARLAWSADGRKLRGEKAAALAKGPAETPEQRIARIEAEAEARARGTSKVPGRPRVSDPARVTGNKISIITSYRNDPDVKDFPAVRDAFTTGLDASARNNSTGDIILMRMIAKATDPTTGVREEEFRTFEGAQGELAKRGIALTKKMWGQGTLNEYGRTQLRGVLTDIYNRKHGQYRSASSLYEGLATEAGFNPKELIRDMSVSSDTTPAQARPAAPAAAPPATATRKGYVRVIGPDGSSGQMPASKADAWLKTPAGKGWKRDGQ